MPWRTAPLLEPLKSGAGLSGISNEMLETSRSLLSRDWGPERVVLIFPGGCSHAVWLVPSPLYGPPIYWCQILKPHTNKKEETDF